MNQTHNADGSVTLSAAGGIRVATPSPADDSTLIATTEFVQGEISGLGGGGEVPAEITIAASNETDDLTTGTAKMTLRIPYAMTITSIRASVTDAPTGSDIIVDVNKTGVGSLFSTPIHIDADDKTSVGSATPAVLTTTAISDDDEITIDIDQIGSTLAGKGLKVCIKGTRTGGNVFAELLVAASDEVTDLTVGDGKATFRMPYAMTLTAVRACMTEAPTGSGVTVDIEMNGTTILSTLLTVDDGDETSVGAATPPVISTTSLLDDAEIKINIDAVGSTTAGKGLKVLLKGVRA